MNPSTALSTALSAAATPWWRVGMVWLVVGGPALVVVAACATAVIAWHGADPVLSEMPALPKAGQVQSATPALQARNHAATARP